MYHLESATLGADSLIAQVAHQAQDRPTPVCFCFAHTADDLVADAAAHDGISTIKAEIKQAVADGECACEHLNPSTRCCLADIRRILQLTAATNEVTR